ncbi:MAG: VWA domain-containing protein [Promethearchaeota archaeon]|nr:MAG: VWA domain-containing protein [Candidatus Lokiarchaeota archaeon]
MHDIKIEDAIVILDTSRSMLRKDFKPNRLIVAIDAVKNFIQTKFTIDLKDRIALLTFGEETKILTRFTNDENKLISSLEKLEISGKGNLNEAIAFSLQLLVEEMRKIGGKIFRIFIITDNKIVYDDRLTKMINIAQGLGIFIDTCQLGKSEDYNRTILKQIAKTTKGEFGFFNNSKAILNSGKSFASKKDIKSSTDYFNPNKTTDIAPLVNEIALPLRRPSLLDIRLMMDLTNKSTEKCQICHSTKAPLTKADFYSEGRYCPSCDRPMHLSCAAMWAKKSEYKENVFRCPFCYFLLVLPESISKLLDEPTEEAPKIKIIDGSNGKTTKMVLYPEQDIANINASCSYCHSIFLGDYKVYQCENCGAYYHEPCLIKMNEEIHACRNCGSRISTQ